MPAEPSPTPTGPLIEAFVNDITIGKKQFTVKLSMGRGPIAATLVLPCLNVMRNTIEMTYGEDAYQTRTDCLTVLYPNDNCIEFIMILEE